MNSELKAVLELVEAKRISPEEGRRRLAELRAGTRPAPSAPADGGGEAPRGIAVVGLSARFSGSADARRFWRDLSEGVCSVREVPPDRWDAERYYAADPSTPGRTNSRWGGFLDDVDAFDPLFFNISGHEAERMDPQQRLFLQASWTALEDAGYAADAVSGLSCGVFAGAPASDYADDLHRSGTEADAQVLMGNDSAILSARISYLLNLRGPSIALNTACSSSLVAVHLACQAIESGQCEMALAGGVCLFVGPGFYISASKADMLSPRGLCRTFDEGADGFVPGEGVGVVVLKDLEAALRDGDTVRGVILAADTNQDGKTNGITAPSSRSQTAVQLSAYRKAGIDPSTISLVEAHGTGTPLGDPVEIDALTRSFREFTDRTGFCAIGSVKTNIGHTGQAAGVAGLIKILLALEHETIPPTLHFDRENRRIRFADSPFRVATERQPWPRTPGAPRRAALSSFGYSGTNAHIVVEEPPAREARADDGADHLLLVSAKTAEALEQRLTDLRAWLGGPEGEAPLADVAYTLHAGRKHFSHRAALVAGDREEFARALDARIDRGPSTAAVRLDASGRDRAARELEAAFARSPEGDRRREVLREAAGHYERGLTPDVGWCFPGGRGRRVPLPTYPFAKERYWTRKPEPGSAPSNGRPSPAQGLATGVVLEDRSDGTQTRYRFRSDGSEFFVNDHVVNGRKVLAGTASLELARAAGRCATGSEPGRLTDVTWHRPLPADHPEGLDVLLTAQGDALRFDVRAAGESLPGATGLLRFGEERRGEPRADLAELRARSTVVPVAECYRTLGAMGFEYGPGFRVMREVRRLDDQVIARIGLPGGFAPGPDLHPLHPGLLDGALQAMTGFDHGPDAAAAPRVPHTLEEVVHHAPLRAECDAHLVRRRDGLLDVRVLDGQGNVLVSLHGLASAAAPRTPEAVDLLRFEPSLRPAPAPSRRLAARTVLVVDTTPDTARELSRTQDARVVLVTPGAAFRGVGADRFEAVPGSRADYGAVLDALGPQGRPDLVIVAPPDLPGPAGEDPAPETAAFQQLLALCQAFTGRFRGHPVRIRAVRPAHGPAPVLTALGAFARTVRLEDPDLRVQVLAAPGELRGLGEGHPFWDVLLADGSPDEPRELRAGPDGALLQPGLREVPPVSGPTPVRDGGTCLVTGGTGHVGWTLAQHLLSRGARVVLTARSQPGTELRERIERTGGDRVAFLRADAADAATMTEALTEARRLFGPIRGVVHAAGVVHDSLMAVKTPEQADQVLRAKVVGARLLDRLTGQDPLDFLVLCSSLAAATGNVGQADYAYANAFLDGFAEEREVLRGRGERSGRTVSVAWPAWEGGGMAARSGAVGPSPDMPGLEAGEAAALLDEALAFGGPRLLYAKGRPHTLRSVLSPAPHGDRSGQEAPQPDTARPDGADLRSAARELLTGVLAEVLRVPVERIDPHEALEAYGFDSVMVTRLTGRLEEDFGTLPKTLFFEYQNLAELAEYFADRYPRVLAAPAGSGAETVRGDEPSAPAERSAPTPPDPAGRGPVPPSRPADPTGEAEIAVIGVSGRYPQAPDLDAFWDNLVHGRDGVTEIPDDRWPLEGFYTPQGEPGGSYSKWGGFLEGIDRFDSLFFNISPKEAEVMDPQERLFLETTWHLLENAGYPRSRLAGGDTGVFVGVMYGHYQLLARPDGRAGVSSFASIANRVSYFLDVHGPSLALDTMCSSSLTAIHLACESLRRGECATAIAGGVNLSPHPRKYVQLSQTGFASSDGRCRSFGAGGDGYVPGEGVGALLLKPLAAALADGDTVQAVIRGSAVNHGGKTNGYTVPNPRAQRSAVADALARSATPPSEVGYVEAHGTGTALGDPIEIAALNGAFGSVPGGPGSVPIGSVKSSIGHLESAAGIAAVTKVILQMRHRTLVPSLHADPPNPEIDFADSPFRVQTELAPWEPAGEAGLVAGVSSFGAGGANAHVILRDHRPAPRSADTASPQVLVLSARDEGTLRELARRTATLLEGRPPGVRGQEGPPLLEDLLSRVSDRLGLRAGDLRPDDSLSESGLDEVARAGLGADLAAAYGLDSDVLPGGPDTVAELAESLTAQHGDAPGGLPGADRPAVPVSGPDPAPLADVAHTLQSGREAMASRLAFVTSDTATAARVLRAFARGEEAPVPVFHGTVSGPSAPGAAAERDAGGEAADALAGGRLDRLAELWTQGADVDWKALHPAPRRMVPLAEYPFVPDRHWLVPVRPEQPTLPPRGTDRPVSAPPLPPVHATAAPADPDPSTRVRDRVVSLAAEAIGLAEDRLDPAAALTDHGFDSMALKELADRIAQEFGVSFSPAVFFERTGAAAVAQWLVEEHGDRLRLPGRDDPAQARTGSDAVPAVSAAGSSRPAPEEAGAEPIAIIGMSGRFPGSPDLDRYWENLRDRRDLVTEIPAERWDWRALDDDALPPEERCPFRWGAFIDGADRFDPLFFGLSPAEAEMMDPQQRVLLETVWAAVEDAGYRPSALAGGDVGLFAGIQFNDYQHLMHEAGVLNAQAALGNEHAISVNRISYLLDLRGPSEPVNTACSSSLVAVHRAVRSLRAGESSMAVAGGVALNLAAHSTVAAGMMGLLSPDGRCKTLDSRANGYVKGEGVGAVLLKPLSRALADGDHVHAVIRGTSVNHGGRAASLTAPNPQAQAELLRSAMAEAGTSPETIGYLELHGTGTELGDPVEINGLRAAFGPASGDASCGIGSVKTNIGHLEPASGIAGLLKVVMAMRHRTLPGMVHLEQVNPYVDLEGTRFRIVRETTPWEGAADGSGAVPLRAGVSSFGFGGVNAHAVLEEPPALQSEESPRRDGDLVFVFSARTEEDLDRVVARFLERTERWKALGDAPRPEAVAFTLRSGREEMAERLAVVAPDLDALGRALRGFVEGGEADSALYRGTAGKPRHSDARGPEALAREWVGGAAVDWDDALPLPRTRTPLPTYPFSGRRYWFTAPEGVRRLPASSATTGGVRAAPDVQGAESGLRGLELVQSALHGILARKLKLEDGELDDDRDLQDFGVDSMLSAMITQVLQDELDVQIPVTALVEHPTVRSLARYVFEECLEGREPAVLYGASAGRGSGQGGGRGNALPPELLPIQTGGTGQTSFWVHGATGYSTWFQQLSEVLGPDYPLYAFQAKGTDGHSMPHSLDEMVDHYVACVRQVQPEGPYVIGGYSFGGLIAMEMARRLHEEGETIRHLVMFDTYPATQEVFDRHAGIYDEDFLQTYLTNYFLKVDEHPERVIRQEDIAHLPQSLRVAELARMAKDRGQKRISADDIYLYLSGGLTCSAHSEGIYQQYAMRSYDASPVLFFQATDGFTGRASKLYWRPTRILDGYDYLAPWREVVEGGFDVVELDNDHLNMLENPTLPTAARHIEGVLRQPPALDTGRYEEFQSSFDAVTRFGHRLLADTLRGAGALPDAGGHTTREEMARHLGVGPEHSRLLHACVDILEREGYVDREGNRLVAAPGVASVERYLENGTARTRAEALAAEFPEAADYLPLLLACQEALPDVLSGRRSGTDVIFPGGSMELVAELYKGNIQTDYYNRLVADRVREHVRSFKRRFPWSNTQVIEVGAGTGATSAVVLDALADDTDRLRYLYTDIGPAFLRAARQQFGPGRGFLEFAAYDVEGSPEAQGVEPHSMDVVVAGNVLHTTRRIDRTLEQCAALLKPGGIVVVNELTRRLDFNTLTFGLTPGWWLFEDERIQGSPLLSTGDWDRALRRSGFTDTEFHGVPGVAGDDHAQCVVVAVRR